MNVVKYDERSKIAVIELSEDYYVVEYDRSSGRVKSVMYSDMPSGDGVWVANASDFGLQYVATPRSKEAAMSGYRRAVKRCHEYLDYIEG